MTLPDAIDLDVHRMLIRNTSEHCRSVARLAQRPGDPKSYAKNPHVHCWRQEFYRPLSYYRTE
jgi:hypothetical protein